VLSGSLGGSTFRAVEELRVALRGWLKIYHEHWLIERHGYRSPAQARRDWEALPLQEPA
jgi:hypothetical protein